jgi:hypothetical protein
MAGTIRGLSAESPSERMMGSVGWQESTRKRKGQNETLNSIHDVDCGCCLRAIRCGSGRAGPEGSGGIDSIQLDREVDSDLDCEAEGCEAQEEREVDQAGHSGVHEGAEGSCE